MPLSDHQRTHILALARKHGVESVRLFGSRARQENSDDSDLDLLIVMAPGRSLIDHIAFQQDLEDLLDISVDVVTEKSLHPHIRQRVLEEAMQL